METAEVKKAGTWQGIVVVLLNQLPMMAIVALMPALPTLMQHFKDVKHNDLLVPLILTAPGLCIALLSPIAGMLIDRYGRRKLLIIFTLIYGLGGTLPFFIDGFNAVFASRLLLGIGEAFVIVIGNTFLGDYFSEKDRTKWLTIQVFFGSIAAAGLLSLSGNLTSFGWNYPFLIYSFTFLVGIMCYIFLFEPQAKQPSEIDKKREDLQFPKRTAILVALVTLGTSLLYFVYTIHFSRALDAMGIKDKIQLGNLSAIASIGVPLGALLFRVMANRASWQQIALMFFLIGSGLCGIGVASSSAVVVSFALIQQLGCGMTIAVLVAWALKQFPIAFRGRGMGIWTSAFFLGQFLNPFFMKGLSFFYKDIASCFLIVGIGCGIIIMALLVVNLIIIKER